MFEPFYARLPDTLAFNALFVVAAVGGLWWGAAGVVGGAKTIARNHRIPDLVIGLTAVSIASSLPEIMVSTSAGWREADDVAVGNIVGSCLVQITLILGVVTLLGGALSAERRDMARDGAALLAAPIILIAFGLDGRITTIEGAIFVGLYAVYVAFVIVTQRGAPERAEAAPAASPPASEPAAARPQGDGAAVRALLIGAGAVWITAELLVHAGVAIGEELAVPQSIVGMWAGVGTSVPELAISLVAIFGRLASVSLGNLIGSNITDPLFSLGVAALASSGLAANDFLLFTASPVWIAVTVLAVVLLWTRGEISRLSGAALIAIYAGAAYWIMSG